MVQAAVFYSRCLAMAVLYLHAVEGFGDPWDAEAVGLVSPLSSLCAAVVVLEREVLSGLGPVAVVLVPVGLAALA